MKKTVPLTIVLLLSAVSSLAFSGSDFDRMKALAGEWEATTPEGKTRVTFQVISNGTALMETMVKEKMVSVYHPDGNSILMTHYCAAGNQPRMRAQISRGDTLAFEFVDVANVKGAEGHMQRVVIKFQDANHLIEEWTWKEGGKETTAAFNLQRVK